MAINGITIETHQSETAPKYLSSLFEIGITRDGEQNAIEGHGNHPMAAYVGKQIRQHYGPNGVAECVAQLQKHFSAFLQAFIGVEEKVGAC